MSTGNLDELQSGQQESTSHCGFINSFSYAQSNFAIRSDNGSSIAKHVTSFNEIESLSVGWKMRH